MLASDSDGVTWKEPVWSVGTSILSLLPARSVAEVPVPLDTVTLAGVNTR